MKKILIFFISFFSLSIICQAQNKTWRTTDIEETYGHEIIIEQLSAEFQKSAAELTLIEKKPGKYKRFKYSFDYWGNVKSKTISPYLDGSYYVLGECSIEDILYVRMQTRDSSTIFLLPKDFINQKMLWCCYMPEKVIAFFDKYQFIEQNAYNQVYRIDDYNDRGRGISIHKPYHQFGDKKYAKIEIKDLQLDKGTVTLTGIYFRNETFSLADIETLVKGHALVSMEEIEAVKMDEARLLDSAKALYNPKDNIQKGYSDFHKQFKNDLVHLVGQEIMYCGYSMSYTQGDIYIIDSVVPYKDILHTDPIKLHIRNKQTGSTATLSGKESEINEKWIVMGHLEYLKDSLVGKDYVYQYEERFSFGSPMKQVGTNKKMTDVPNKSIWKCIDVRPQLPSGQSVMYSANPFIIFQNETYGQGYCYESSVFDKEKPDFKYRMTEKKKYDEETKAEQKKKQDRINKLSAKFGKQYAKLIADGKVKIGMTREMCKEAWGEPDDINVSIGSWGRHEQWVYGEIYSSYLYFENGKLTAIQK